MKKVNMMEITGEYLKENGFEEVESNTFLHREYHIALYRYKNVIDSKTEYEWKYADIFGSTIWHLKYIYELKQFVLFVNSLMNVDYKLK